MVAIMLVVLLLITSCPFLQDLAAAIEGKCFNISEMITLFSTMSPEAQEAIVRIYQASLEFGGFAQSMQSRDPAGNEVTFNIDEMYEGTNTTPRSATFTGPYTTNGSALAASLSESIITIVNDSVMLNFTYNHTTETLSGIISYTLDEEVREGQGAFVPFQD